MNLLVNAAQSIPEGDAARHEVRVATAYDPQSGRVTVEIADTGRGIAPGFGYTGRGPYRARDAAHVAPAPESPYESGRGGCTVHACRSSRMERG